MARARLSESVVAVVVAVGERLDHRDVDVHVHVSRRVRHRKRKRSRRERFKHRGRRDARGCPRRRQRVGGVERPRRRRSRLAERAPGAPHVVPLGTELGCVLGVMISWRAYVKVIGLMGWWREGRTRSEREEEDWKFFFDALAAAAVVAVAGGVLDFVLAGGGEWGGSSW
ncbi:LOW QUALITY PROTEIN: uncharacterized protein MICPUCDRAFT_68654 [Micromonas pusilla CCMP1545]|uniref:Predicted protein n=1 Tax=Micromonas pusilla (strain CCMP1545) TaxID=564608 RepID=C1N3I4_MICPC|nr:LOW QUALITY PROTEIN: uncharacterized protein MICPUCDRAFT_68654 [Micromonas pusilla CCMP1545]EEH53437.1 predicted protein [Micromonas pusilla CCMP1545]|eukprot:XP_003062618.1 predicted protein [Micromonas pusilla CCMP1545]